jgi:MoaA/NifB/PqqE/SkfB family radical SAM enzyme
MTNLMTRRQIDGARQTGSGSDATWCILPWVHLFVGETGTIRPCCMTLEQPDQVNRDEAGEPFHAYGDAPLEEIWNSPFMRSLRLEMLEGKRPDICARCYRDEDLGIRSHRRMSNAMFDAQTDQALSETAEDGTAPPSLITSLDLRLGNRCNLKCRMCSPVSSRATLSDYAALFNLPPDHHRLTALAGREDWVADPSFHDLFVASSSGAERVQFSGGEPLLIPEMETLLKSLVDRSLAPGIELHYISNLTVLPEKYFTYWAQFRRIGFLVSLDAIGRVGEYIRRPMQWTRLDENLKTLDARASEINCDSPHMNITVQAYNIFSLDETITYIADALPHFGRPRLSLLYYPEHLGIQLLPPALKREAEERLTRVAKRIEGGWPSQWDADEASDLLATIKGVIDHMNRADRSDLLDEFRRWTRVLDHRRNESVLDAIPELAPIFTDLERVGEP